MWITRPNLNRTVILNLSMAKFIFQPISPWRVTQHFGENKACVDDATGSKVITCDGNNPPEGYHGIYGPLGHTGLDVASQRWNPVYAACDGTVRLKETVPQRGLGIGIVHQEAGKWYMTKYWHLAAMDVDLGEAVGLGDFIGYADNTGWSSGDHLHFELGLSDEMGTIYTPIDPVPHMYPTFALTAKKKIAYIREQLALIADKLADFMRGR